MYPQMRSVLKEVVERRRHLDDGQDLNREPHELESEPLNRGLWLK